MPAENALAPGIARDIQPSRALTIASIAAYAALYLLAGRSTAFWIEALIAIPVALVTARLGPPAGLFALVAALPLNLTLFSLLGGVWSAFFVPARLAPLATGLAAVWLASRLRTALRVLAEQRQLVRRTREIEPALLPMLVQSVPCAVLQLDPAERVVFFHCSEAIPLELPDGKRAPKLDELLPPSGVRRLRRAVERLRHGTTSEPFVVQLCDQDGTIVDLEGRVANGRAGIWCRLARSQPATDQPPAPHPAVADDAIGALAQLAQHHTDALIVRRLTDGEILFANPPARALFATRADDGQNGRAELPLHPSDRKRIQRLRDDPPAQGYEEEYRVVQSDGSTRWLEERGVGLQTDGGRLLVLRASDIHRRKVASEALQNSEHRFRHLIDYAVDAFYLVDSLGQIVDCNQGACVELDYTREELLRCTITDISPRFLPVDRAELDARLAEGEAVPFETTHRRKSGSTFPVEARASRLERGNEELLLVVARNVTAKTQSEREHRATLGALEEIVACRSADEIYQTIPQKLGEIFMFPVVTLERLHRATQETEVMGSHGPIPRGARTPVSESLSGRAAQTRSVRAAEEPFDPSRTGAQWLDHYEIKTIICIPLLAGARLWGTICFADTNEREQTSTLNETLRALAPVIATALAEFDDQEELRVTKLLLDHDHDARLALRRDARIITATQQASHLLGHSVEWLRGATWFQLEPNLDERAFQLRADALRRPNALSEHRLVSPNGDARRLVSRWRLIDDDDELLLVELRPSPEGDP